MNNIILCNYSNTTHLIFYIRNGKWNEGNRDFIQVDNYLEEGKWIHVAVTFNNTTGKAKIFKNGESVKEKDMLNKSSSEAQPLKIEPNKNRQKAYIGKSNWSHDPNFKGAMSNLYFFDKELSANHIMSLFNGINDDGNDISGNNEVDETPEEIKQKSIDDIQINPNWIRFFKVK